MAEQRMKVRDKKVQKMTKDGLVEENLTDKSSVRVSNRASDVQMGGKQGEKEVSLPLLIVISRIMNLLLKSNEILEFLHLCISRLLFQKS